jgi:hypothetical protein
MAGMCRYPTFLIYNFDFVEVCSCEGRPQEDERCRKAEHGSHGVQ